MNVVAGFPRFRPAAWLRNGHLQTIVPAFWGPPAYPYRAVQTQIQLPDGDQLVLHDDCPEDWRPSGPVALLVHGLTGSHSSAYMIRIAAKLKAHGVRAFRLDQRGCGAGESLAVRPSHAGRSEDLGAVVDHVLRDCPDSPLTLLGFSLGGNVVLKYLGEVAETAPAQLVRAAAVAPPIDLAACSDNLQRGLNRVYNRSFVRGLMRIVKSGRLTIPAPHARFTPVPRTVYEFDNRFTAPLGGFEGVDDYYERASSAPLLASIRVPTLLLAAADDPLIPVSIFAAARMSPAITLHVTKQGGHLGFYGVSGIDPDRFWLDWRVLDWTLAPCHANRVTLESKAA